jgi:adenylate kinase
MNIVILGPQGSGKSTQADLLSKKINLPHVSTGSIFRQIEHDPSDLGRCVKERLPKGLLVSDEDTFTVLAQVLSKPEYHQGVIIDGFPRNLYQAQRSPIKFDKAVYLKVSDETSIARLLKRQREDDTLELIRERLEVYHRETEPVLDYYRQLGVLTEVNGEPSEQEIFSEILSKLRLTA